MKILFLILLTTSLFAEFNQREFHERMMEKPRDERKIICLEEMNKNKDAAPRAAFAAGNCLLYNGYGELAIPLFAEYIYSEKDINKLYFNNRMGYGWLHSSDWYKVGSILSDMTGGMDLYQWIKIKVNEEILNNPKKYGEKVLSLVLYEKTKEIAKEKITDEKKRIFKECKNISVFIDNYMCSYTKEKRLFDCKKGFKNKEFVICNHYM